MSDSVEQSEAQNKVDAYCYNAKPLRFLLITPSRMGLLTSEPYHYHTSKESACHKTSQMTKDVHCAT